MFHLHYDTDLDRLADRLASLLAACDPARLLQPQTVLVPQAGLERWLVQRLAETRGIAANLEFIAPAQMVWRALRARHPGLPPHSQFDREALQWRFLHLLEHPPADEPGVAALVEDDPQALRRFQLAGHLARLFERYQAYRRDLLDAWREGKERDDPQAGLWRALVAGTDEPPRSRLLGDFLHEFGRADAAAPPGLPARLFAFGCLNVSPDVLRFMGILGRHAEMHFFLPTPCREYWGDIPHRRNLAAQLREHGGGYFDQPDNPLLVSMGGLGRDFVAQVFGYDELQPDVETAVDDAEPPRDSLLQRVQADVITLDTPDLEQRRDAPDPDDVSLAVHVCHSPLREVQVLHDRLLALFQQCAELEPRDMAVMVPDIATYAPCIDAVFGSLARGDPRCIPWTVADRPAGQAHALTSMFVALLDVPASRLGLEEVLDVVAVPAVARACGLDGSDLDALREKAMAAGICRDEDADDRRAQGLPAFDEFSWAFGRERLLLGYLLGHDDDERDELVHDTAALTDIEGAGAVAFGELLRVQRVLVRWRARARQPHTPAAWQQLLNRLLDALVPATDDHAEERALEDLRAALATLGDDAALAGYDGTLDWRCVRQFLCDALDHASTHRRFLAGGVSVCGMVPLRNVPFKVICMLGLDAVSFPRQDPADGMSRLYRDRLTGHQRLGDRSVREDDRYLFLQTLMAARKVLHLSYVGINARDGSRIEPSVLVSELLDVVCDGYFRKPDKAREALVITHPMQPFSPRLFDGADPRLFTYRKEWQATAQTVPGPAGPPPFIDVDWPDAEPAERFDLDDLKRFFAAPQKYFLQRCAGLSIAETGGRAPDHEPLVDEPLTRSIRERQVIAQLRRADADEDGTLRWARAHGWLPPLALGAEAHMASLDALVPQAHIWCQRRGRDPAVTEGPCPLTLPSGRVIGGRLAYRDAAGVAAWVGGVRSAGNWMRWWLEALVLCAQQEDASCVAFGRGDDKLPLPAVAKMPPPAGAIELLEELLDIYGQGQVRPLPMPSRSAWAWARDVAQRRKPDADKSLQAAGETWANEADDPWVALALRGVDPVADPAFTNLAQRTYGPLWDALQAGGAP